MANKTQRKLMTGCCEAAAKVLRRDRILKDDGSASAGMGEGDINFDDARELLALAFPFKADVDSHLRQQIAADALFNIGKEPDDEKIVAALVQSEIARLEKNSNSKEIALLYAGSICRNTEIRR